MPYCHKEDSVMTIHANDRKEHSPEPAHGRHNGHMSWLPVVGGLAAAALLLAPACSDDDSGPGPDSGVWDGAQQDAGTSDGSQESDGGTVDGHVIEGACTVGEKVPADGCLCNEIPRDKGWCCEDGWRPFACEPDHKTCADLGVPNCVEVWPNEQREGYEYHDGPQVYFFRDLSNADHYFLLMGDIDCTTTCTVFGFQDGTPDQDATTIFDLNGYTMRYSADDYESLPNNGFEDWSDETTPEAWTVASGAVERRETAYWMPMHGQYLLYTDGAVQLESSSIHLPRARWYQGYVTVGRADENHDILLEVVDASDHVLCSESKQGYFRGQSLACRFLADGPVDVHLRLSTQGYAYFDRTGIVPLGDYGVAVLTAWSMSDSNQNREPIVQNLDGLDIPATGDTANPDLFNHLRVTNGMIIAAHENQVSYGVRLSGIARLTLDHTVIKANGLKSHSVRASGSIHDNYLEVNMPWYFSRENSMEENVIMGGGSFYDNLAVGGQGVIRLRGQGTKVYRNYLRNDAQATNHYAIIHSGAENPEIYENIFDPIEGSGILTYVGHGYKIHDNTFYVTTATCNVEYVNEDYSTNAIRINDYGSGENHDNWIYDNTFYILGINYETAWENCMPVTTGIFYSANGANNRIFDNTFHITKTHDRDDAPVYALYMGGDAENNPADNPLVVGNTFETNDKAIWISTYYGFAADLWFEDNTFIKTENTYYDPPIPESPIRLGYWNRSAEGLRFINNHFEGGFEPGVFQFTATSDQSSYSLSWQWYLHVTVTDGSDGPIEGATVRAISLSEDETVEGTTDANGEVTLIVTEYRESGDMRPDGTHDRTPVTPHRIEIEHGTDSATVESETIDSERTITVQLQ